MKKYLALVGAVLVAACNLSAQSLLMEQPETPAQTTAREVLAAPAQTRDAILDHLADASGRLWDNPDPQAVLDAMGPKAGRLFAINAEFATLVVTLLTSEGDTEGVARVQALLSRIPPHTINEDGTVTLSPVPEEEP